MSPGATFERVYRELKRKLADGELAPGAPIEPMQLTEPLAASITPLRDALHRLVGERLVEAPQHNGFLVPRPTEAALRDLYGWNGLVLGLAVKRMRPVTGTSENQDPADLFLAITRATGSAEHIRAVALLNDRLAPFRHIESQVLDMVADEHALLAGHIASGERSALASFLGRYHRRRMSAAPALLDALDS